VSGTDQAGDHPWTLRLTASAEADYRHIVASTMEQFDDPQARI
jgi:plasmid stabilization system protein ParE